MEQVTSFFCYQQKIHAQTRVKEFHFTSYKRNAKLIGAKAPRDFFLFFSFFKWMVVLGLCCCVEFSLIAANRGSSLVAVHGSLCCRARAPGMGALVAAVLGLSSCSSQALEHRLSSCGIGA